MRSFRIPVLTATVALLGGLLAPVQAAVADDPASDAAVHLVGTLVVIQAEESPTPVTPPQAATGAAATLGAHVILADGASVPIEGGLIPADAASGAPVDVVAAPSAEVLADAGVVASGTVAADSAEGQLIVEAAVVADDPLTVVAGEIGDVDTQAAATAHTIDVAVVSDGSTEPSASTDYVTSVVAKAGAFWTEQSASLVPAITLTTIKRYSSTKGCGTEDSTLALWDEAAKKFGHAGGMDDYLVAGTKHLVVISPASCARTFNGLGSVGDGIGNGGVVWAAFDGGDGSGDELTLAHEIGHNFSLDHANVQQCTYPESDAKVVGASYGSSSCVENPYADLYDVMGMSFVVNDGTRVHGNDNTPALNAISKVRLGLISAADAPVLTATVPTTADYTLNGASAQSGRRALNIVDPISKERYVVEYRNAQGRDAGALYARFVNPPAGWNMSSMGPGVRILKAGPGGTSSVVIPDAVSATSRRLAFVAGHSFTSRTGGLKITVSSLTTSVATVTVVITPPALAFAGTKPPTIVGNRQVGLTLTATSGSDWTPTPTTLAYKWMRNGAAISGATSVSYTPVAADAGTFTTVAVTAARTDYPNKTWTSTTTIKTVADTAFAGEKLPIVTGTRAAGKTLTVAPGDGWTPTPTSYTYQWYRGSAAIAGATESSYTQRPDDIGAIVTASVTAVKAGITSRSYRSATAATTTGAFSGSAVPTIVGEPFVTRTLTAKPSAAWVPAPTSYGYQWYRNGTAIAKATARTHVVVIADKGAKLSVRVTAMKTGVTSRAGVSAATATIASLKSFTGTALPTISGTRKVGSTLTAKAGSNWAPTTTGTTYKYAWYRGTTTISGATAKTYKQVAADAGAVVRVKVTAVRYGYASKSGTSTSTAAKTVK